jgi:hypothetical protein
MRQPWFDTAAPALWPPDDTEESVVASECHQHVIDASRDGLRMAARANGAAWHVLSQVPLAGFRRPDGSAYTMLPDVFVHPRPNPHPRLGVTLTIAEIGVPLLAIEVLSETTYQQDVDERHGKAWSYADAGVAEYLVVDYDRRYIEEHVRALRLVDGHWTRWQADAPYLRVRDAAGRLKPLPDEADALLLEQATQLTEQSSQLRERDILLERIRAFVAAGDLEAVRALLADVPPQEHPG